MSQKPKPKPKRKPKPKARPHGMPTALRLSDALLAELDVAAQSIAREAPSGITVTRSDAVRVLLGEAIAARRARGAM